MVSNLLGTMDSFYPERWQTEEGRKVGAHIPFAIGPRMCIGWRLAMMELKVAACLSPLFYLNPCLRVSLLPSIYSFSRFLCLCLVCYLSA
jgi:hypothetical protein